MLVSKELIRYNFRILAFQNGWLLAVVLAASQLSVFWVGTTQQFTPPLPASVVEGVSPLLGAFLAAHLLAAEYRSAVGAVLACKPVDIRKVVLVRLSLVLLLVFALAGLSLLAFTLSMKPFPLAAPLIACAVSTSFLSLLALTFATLLRHPLAGFGIAALWWLCDLPPGPPMNPFLSLRSLTASFHPPGLDVAQPLTDPWWIAKVVLVVGAAVLYLLHNRFLFLLGTPMTARRTRRTLAAAAGMLFLYLASGAAVKVGYGYTHRNTLFPSDLAWFRRQFGPYGLLPVARCFGTDFTKYLGDIPNSWRIQQDGEADLTGDTQRHRRELRMVFEATPRSPWAASAAYQTALWEAKPPKSAAERAGYWQVLVDRYPESPYAADALARVADSWAEDPEGEEKALAAWRRMIDRFPTSVHVSSAWRYLAEADRREGKMADAEKSAQEWVRTAPVHERFLAWMLLSELQAARDDERHAEESRQAVLASIVAFRKATYERTLTISEPKRVRVEADVRALEAKLRPPK